MTLQAVLGPWNGDYSKLFTPGNTLRLDDKKGWMITHVPIKRKDHDMFFKTLAYDLAREDMEQVVNPEFLAMRINEVWRRKMHFKPKAEGGHIFFSSKDSDNGCLSNFYPTLIYQDGHMFPSSEHFYQWSVASRLNGLINHWNRLRDLEPIATRKYTHSIQQVNEPLSSQEKLRIMARVTKEKYSQNLHLQRALIQTGPYSLVEATENDYWGRGNDGTGKNKLGKILELWRVKLLQKTA